MLTENVSTLKIHKLTQEQYDRELAAGNIDESALYLTPDEEIDLTPYATKDDLSKKADTGHTHDDRYYTETEIDAKVDELNSAIKNITNGATAVKEAEHAVESDIATASLDANKLGGQIPSYYAKTSDIPTGTLAEKDVVSESELDSDLVEKINVAFGGNHNHSNKTVLDGITSTKVSAWDNAEANANAHTDEIASGKADKNHTHDDRYYTEAEVNAKLDGKSDKTHTHNYAGSSSVGGSATSAVKLDTSVAGSATQPVYFSDGKPVATTYSLNKTVPADAKFTDTTYTTATASADGLMSSTDKKRLDSVYGAHEMGSFADKTIADLRTALDSWLDRCSYTANASARFSGTDWINGWNSGDTTKKIISGGTWTVTIIAPFSNKNYTQLRMASYYDEQVVYVHKENGSWGTVHRAAFKDDLDAKQNVVTGAATTITDSNLTASRALVSNASGKVAVSDITSTELGYLDGAKSNIQAQLDEKQPKEATSFIMNNDGGYVSVKTPDRKTGQHYEFWDNDAGWADIKAGAITANGGFVGNLIGNASTATKATQDASGNAITATYETKTDSSSKLSTAKAYADSVAATAANKVKNDLLNGAGGAYDTLKELGDLIDDNTDAIDALEAVAAGKADKSHTHDDRYYTETEIDSKLSGKANTSHGNHVPTTQTANNAVFLRNDNTWATVTPANIGAAASSHGTHVSYSTTAPVMDGTASVGSASTVARSDHKHPTDTSRAAQTALDSHTGDTTKHITSTERTNWNAAKSHADSAHAPSNAQANQNAFSNVKVGSTTIAADTTTDTLELVGSNVTITPDATNDKVTIAVADGSTSTKGIVKLENSTSSTSTTTAATPSSVKSAYDLANTAKTAAANAQATADGKANASHTHNYAGSSSVGGAATSANKVNSSLTVKLNGGSTEGTNLFTFNGSAAKSINITPSSIGAAASSHTHDDRYYTESEVDTKLSGKANSSHGNHVPTTQTANNATFLRNDNTWQKVTPANIGAAASSHTHDDRYYTESEVDTKLSGKSNTNHTHNYAGSSSAGGSANSAVKLATARTISLTGDVTGSTSFDGSGNASITATVADDSHNHVISNVDGLQTALDGRVLKRKATGDAYNSLCTYYGGGSTAKYVRISFPSVPTWTMMSMELTVREDYDSAKYGKLMIYANQSSSAEWNKFFAVYHDTLSSNIKVYASDKKHIYIGGLAVYGGVSLDRMLIGDSAMSSDLTNMTITGVDSLPTTYQTATMKRSFVEGDTLTGNLSGNASTATNVAWGGVTGKPSYYDAKAIKGITRSGTTFTYTCMDGTTGTFTQQDNNTTYSAATSSALGLVKIGSNISVSSGTISLTKANVTSALGYTPPTSNTTYSVVTASANGLVPMFDGADGTIDSSSTDWVLTNNNGSIGWYKLPANAFNNTTYSAATQSAQGLMSAADKKKLDGIATGANAYSLPTASSSTLGGVKTTSKVTSTSGLTACPIISGVPYYKDTNTTYSLSSFGITATAAELNYCDGVTSNIQTQLNGKAASSHGTHVSYGTSASALGTSSAGSASTVSRSDHVHALPALTSCTGTLTVAKGGTGATTAAGAITNLGAMDLTSAQTASGVKTFSNGIKIGNATLTYDSKNKRMVISVA